MIKAILFDLDGTLLDTSEGIMHSIRHTLKTLGYDELPDATILKFIGPPIQNSLMTYMGASSEEAQKGANIFREFYKTKALFEAFPYDGIMNVLRDLKSDGFRIGVATYKREDYAIKLLNHFGISEYCDVIHGADNENKLTKANIVDLCCKELDVEKKYIVLVGDTEHDARGAMEAGVKFIAVTWGFGFNTSDLIIDYPVLTSLHNAYDLMPLLSQNR